MFITLLFILWVRHSLAYPIWIVKNALQVVIDYKCSWFPGYYIPNVAHYHFTCFWCHSSCNTELRCKLIATYPKKTAEFSQHLHWFPCKMLSEKKVQKFYTDDMSYPDLGSASDWSCHVENLLHPTRSTTQIWVVTHHQYGISADDINGETNGGVAKCQLFSLVTVV